MDAGDTATIQVQAVSGGSDGNGIASESVFEAALLV